MEYGNVKKLLSRISYYTVKPSKYEREGFVLQIAHSWLQLYFNVQLQIYFIREQLGGPRTVTKWEYAATMSESLVSKNLIFVEIPLD